MKKIIIGLVIIILFNACTTEADIYRNNVIKKGQGQINYSAFFVDEFGWECVSVYHGGLYCMRIER